MITTDKLPTNDDLDDDDPLWCVNEQIKGLLEGEGAHEDHDSVVRFLLATGLPKATVDRIHRAIVSAEKSEPVAVYEADTNHLELLQDCVMVKGWRWYRKDFKRGDKLYTHAAPNKPEVTPPIESINKILTEVMDLAVANGADSRSMPDEYVEVAAWLCGIKPVAHTPIPDILFDGYAVFQRVKERAGDNGIASPQNVSEVLDAVVSLMREGVTTSQQTNLSVQLELNEWRSLATGFCFQWPKDANDAKRQIRQRLDKVSAEKSEPISDEAKAVGSNFCCGREERLMLENAALRNVVQAGMIAGCKMVFDSWNHQFPDDQREAPQPVGEPIAVVVGNRIPDGCNDQISTMLPAGIKIYTSPQSCKRCEELGQRVKVAEMFADSEDEELKNKLTAIETKFSTLIDIGWAVCGSFGRARARHVASLREVLLSHRNATIDAAQVKS